MGSGSAVEKCLWTGKKGRGGEGGFLAQQQTCLRLGIGFRITYVIGETWLPAPYSNTPLPQLRINTNKHKPSF